MEHELNPDAVPENPDEAPGTQLLKQTLKIDSPVFEKSPEEEISVEEEKPAEIQDDTDYKKRHGDAMRMAQRERQARQSLQARLDKWKDSGIDPDEIDRLIAGDTSQDKPNPDQQNLVSKKDLSNAMSNFQWELARRDFIDRNSEFKDDDMGTVLNYSVQQIVQEEMRDNGMLTSSQNEILTKAAKRARAFTAKFIEQGKKSATEQRKKISDTAITEGKDKKKVLDEEEEKPYDPKADYIKMRQERRF